MSAVHGKLTVIKIATADISPYANASELTRGGDSHDKTGYGKNAHVFHPGLGTGSFTCSGVYDNTATTGSAAVLKPLVNTMVQVIRQVEGTGSGLPQESFEAHFAEYTESAPVADMVQWSANFTVSDEIDDTPQAA